MAYAENTTVPVAKSKMEIELMLTKYGATGFISGWSGERASIGFEMMKRRIMFQIPLPDRNADTIKYDGRKNLRTVEKQLEAYEQAQRRSWRALMLVIKAKLEAVESGITMFEDEFMAHIVLPNGGTVGEFMRPQIERSYQDNKMPPLLPSPKS